MEETKMYDPRSQNYDAIEHNIRAARNANEYVYDSYQRVTAWKILKRCLWAVLIIGAILTLSFAYVESADAQVPASVHLQMSTTLSAH